MFGDKLFLAYSDKLKRALVCLLSLLMFSRQPPLLGDVSLHVLVCSCFCSSGKMLAAGIAEGVETHRNGMLWLFRATMHEVSATGESMEGHGEVR